MLHLLMRGHVRARVCPTRAGAHGDKPLRAHDCMPTTYHCTRLDAQSSYTEYCCIHLEMPNFRQPPAAFQCWAVRMGVWKVGPSQGQCKQL